MGTGIIEKKIALLPENLQQKAIDYIDSLLAEARISLEKKIRLKEAMVA
jgi:hypothetical protein